MIRFRGNRRGTVGSQIVGTDDVPYSNRIIVGMTTLVGGTSTIACLALTESSMIFVAPQSGTINLGALGVSVRTVGTGFTVLSNNPLDARRFAWAAIEP